MSGPQCCSNPPALNPSSGSGHVEKLAGLDSYVTGSHDSNFALLLITDIFGYEAPNLRKLADKIAGAGFYVVAPDFFFGDPYVPDKFESIYSWLPNHGTDKGFEDAKQVIEALKSKGFSSIGAAGFCWGGKVVVELGKCELIQAAVLCHPAFVTVDDINEVKTPIAVLGAEIDVGTPPALIKQFGEVLDSKPEVDGYVKIFPKVEHGWTTRYDVEDDEASKCANEAHGNMLEWFAKYLK